LHRVAWTLADLDAVPSPTPDHVGWALFLRKSVSA
jgi:magnesium chelatase family protein